MIEDGEDDSVMDPRVLEQEREKWTREWNSGLRDLLQEMRSVDPPFPLPLVRFLLEKSGCPIEGEDRESQNVQLYVSAATEDLVHEIVGAAKDFNALKMETRGHTGEVSKLTVDDVRVALEETLGLLIRKSSVFQPSAPQQPLHSGGEGGAKRMRPG
uniref:Uncharacterized protein n=1 Tax=Chromera velia CCMP2878 TaxID=1169474 RepID=A0A0G4F4Q7_9ALVE|eukprot:Cvel_156.t1-p1 / transcript=Cvel_156.t1 / gene=Cvel_156 / organism=Chromera_velia_CCMP2878 / gene_product=hypothetical protein / transcript_product=hypothetical protein / location=Cvel_scaffold10:72349-76772(+) / protein_length=156 / sequence_SO=supercontig / SO=protein_coding / is_pseudo=false